MIVCIGLNYWQSRLVAAAKRQGRRVVGVDINPNAPGRSQCDIYLQASAHDPEGIVAAMHRSLVDPGEVEAFLTLGTRGALTSVAELCAQFKVAGAVVSNEASAIIVDRAQFRSFMQRIGLPTPCHAIVQSANAEIPFPGPWVVKAARDTSGSEGLTVVQTSSELGPAIERALTVAQRRGGGAFAIVEQYIVGKDIGVFSIFRAGAPIFNTIVDRCVTDLPHCLPQRYAIPADLDRDTTARAVRCAHALASSLEVGSGPLYTEIRIQSDTGLPFIIETEPTLPAFISTLIGRAYEIELEDLFLRVALDSGDFGVPHASQSAVCRFLYGPTGMVASIERPSMGAPDVIADTVRQIGDRLDATSCSAICAYAVASGSVLADCDARARQYLAGFDLRMVHAGPAPQGAS